MSAALHHWRAIRAALAAERLRPRGRWDDDGATFLPAAIEIVERPVSPTGRRTAWALLTGLVAAIAWLAFGKVDVVASASGQMLPAQGIQEIQPAAGGVIHAILVQDGDRVRKGQPLVTLDPTMSTADVARARDALAQSVATLTRTRAVLAALDGAPLALAAPLEMSSDARATQLALARAQLADIEGGEQEQAARREAAAAARREAAIQAAKLAESLPLLDQQIAANEELLAKGYVSKLKVIEMRRERLGAARDRDAAMETARKALSEMAVASAAQIEARSQARAKLLDALAQAADDTNQRRADLDKALRQSNLQTVASPVDGVVTQSQVHTIGGVVESGKMMMAIVPANALLVADVKVLDRDIGFVRAGQAVTVKLAAFPFTRYGALAGRVQRIGAAAAPDEKLGLVYPVRILLDRPATHARKRVLPGAGMQVTADIRTGRRSILSYLLSPIDRAFGEAARER